MNDNQTNTPADVPWRAAGIGHHSNKLCMGKGCGPAPILGGRGLGPKWRCAKCVAKRPAA